MAIAGSKDSWTLNFSTKKDSIIAKSYLWRRLNFLPKTKSYGKSNKTCRDYNLTNHCFNEIKHKGGGKNRTLCLRAKSSNWDRKVDSCSFIKSVLILATFSPSSRYWSYTTSMHKKGHKRLTKKIQNQQYLDCDTRAAAAVCNPPIPGRLLISTSKRCNFSEQERSRRG